MAGRNWATTSGVSAAGFTARIADLLSKGTGSQSVETRLKSMLHSRGRADTLCVHSVHLLGGETPSMYTKSEGVS